MATAFNDFKVPSSYIFEASLKGSDEKDQFEIEDYVKMGESFFSILGNYLIRKHIVSNFLSKQPFMMIREPLQPPKSTKNSA